MICLAAIAIRHTIDMQDYIIWGLAAAVFALGAWGASRIKPPEDLTGTIFPDSQ